MELGNLVEMLTQRESLIFTGVVVGFLLLVLVVGNVGRRQPLRDPQRLFTPEQRAELFRLCGGRCEYKSPLWFRCRQGATHADHVYPHSRGGVTQLRNAQGLCAFHNLSKSAKVPGRFYMSSLARRRARYYPPGAPRKVSWKVELPQVR